SLRRFCFFFSSRRRHTRSYGDWSSDVCSSDLWTHFGISGPVALNASRHWERARLAGADARLTVSFCPEHSFERIDERLIAAAKARPRASPQSILAGWLPASVAATIVERLEVGEPPLSQLPRDERRRLAHALAASPLEVTATRG